MIGEQTVALEQSVQTSHRQRGMSYLIVAVALAGFTMSLQTGMNSNFIAQTMQLSGREQGILEAFRESCGIIALGVMYLLAGMSEPRIASMMLLVMGLGMASYAVVPTFGWLVLASLTWSQGFHTWVPLPNAMALAMADDRHEGRALGRLSSAGAVGSAVALVLALGLIRVGVQIRPIWVIAGAASALAGIACLGIPRDIKAPGARLILRRRYGLYYMMQFLEGWRKQIFIAFAGYLLVKEYGASLSTLLLLFLIAQAAGWFTGPLLGRIIDRFGERSVLLCYYPAMAGIFVSYTLVRVPAVLYVLFVLDSILFVCTMAMTTYIGRLAPKSEHTATLSAGVAFNHIAAVAMPLVGGILWEKMGYAWTFYAGAAVALISVIPASLIPRRTEAARA